jgi:hypothetical protein
MVKQLRSLFKRLSGAAAGDPGRFAGGSAVDGPPGQLAAGREELTRRQRSRRGAEPAGGRR